MSKDPVRVAVTGGAGQIGYSILFRIASGQLLGPEQPVILHLLEITPALDGLRGVAKDLVIVFQTHPEHRIRQQFHDRAAHFEEFFFRHRRSVSISSGLIRGAQ